MLLVQVDHSADETQRIAREAPLTAGNVGTTVLKGFAGQPFIPLREVPGRAALVILGVALLMAAAATVVRAGRRRRVGGRVAPSAGVGLIALLAVAAPLGAVLFGLQPDKSILLPRNLIVSFPGAVLLVGWLLSSLGRAAGAAATLVVLAVLALGTVESLGSKFRRPPYKQAAHLIDREAGPRDAVIYYALAQRLSTQASDPLLMSFRRPHDVFLQGVDDQRAWRRSARGGRVFVVRPRVGILSRALQLPSPLNRRFRLRSKQLFEGLVNIEVYEYEGVRARV